MKIIKLIILSAFLFLSSFSADNELNHPFYLSLTDIYLKPEDKIVEVGVRVFADDFEEALKKLTGMEGQINGSTDTLKYIKVFEWYFQGRLHISVNDKNIPLEVIGYEMEDEAVWIYLEGNLNEDVKKVDINNSILYDYLERQSNMVHCWYKGKRQSFKLNYPERNYNLVY